MTFSESSYEASKALQDLESQGLRGHTALLEGVSTGSAKVFKFLIYQILLNVTYFNKTLIFIQGDCKITSTRVFFRKQCRSDTKSCC